MSTIYSNAVISARLGTMLDADRIHRMIVATTTEDASKILLECGWDVHDDVDTMLSREFTKTVREFLTLCTDKHLLSAVRAMFLYHNASAIYRDIDSDGALYPVDATDLSPTQIRTAIQKQSFDALPKHLATAFEDLRINSKSDAETRIMQAMYADILSRRIPREVKEYFRTQIDILNLRNTAKGLTTFIDGGTPKDMLRTKYLDLLDALDGGIDKFENASQAYLINQIMSDDGNLFTTKTTFAWFVKKLEELRIARIILTGKKFGATRDELRERLRGLV